MEYEPLRDVINKNTDHTFNQRHTIGSAYSANKSTFVVSTQNMEGGGKQREKNHTQTVYDPNLTMFNNTNKQVNRKRGGATEMHTDCSTPLKGGNSKFMSRVLIGDPGDNGRGSTAVNLDSGVIRIYLPQGVFSMVRLSNDVSVAELFDKLMHHLRIDVKHAKRYIFTYQVLPNKTEKSLYYNEKPISTIKVPNEYIYIYIYIEIHEFSEDWKDKFSKLATNIFERFSLFSSAS